MRFEEGREGVSWAFFEAMARAFREWRAIHPYANPRLLADTLLEQTKRQTTVRTDADVVPPGGPPRSA